MLIEKVNVKKSANRLVAHMRIRCLQQLLMDVSLKIWKRFWVR